MKVLDKKTWQLEVQCGSCKSQLLVERDDVRQRDKPDPDGCYSNFFVLCCECKEIIFINQLSLPRNIRSTAKKEALPI